MGGQSCFIRNLSDLAHLFNETLSPRQECAAFCATAVTRLLFFFQRVGGANKTNRNWSHITNVDDAWKSSLSNWGSLCPAAPSVGESWTEPHGHRRLPVESLLKDSFYSQMNRSPRDLGVLPFSFFSFFFPFEMSASRGQQGTRPLFSRWLICSAN